MASKSRGGLSKREWEKENPGQTAPSDSKSSKGYDKEISGYREKLIEALKPTSEENALGDQISNVEQSRDTGIQHIKEKPIEMTPILGQSRNVEDRAALELGTLNDRLVRLQNDRAMNSQALSTALGFAVDDRNFAVDQERYDTERGTALSQYADTKAMNEKTFAEGVRQYNQNYDLQNRQENRLSSGGSGGGSNIKWTNANVNQLVQELAQEGQQKGLYGGYLWDYISSQAKEFDVPTIGGSTFDTAVKKLFNQ